MVLHNSIPRSLRVSFSVPLEGGRKGRMEIDGNCRNIASAIAVVLLAYAGVAGSSPKHQTPTGDRIAIERLHRLDVEATLTDSADELSKLWDKDAVRLQHGQLMEIRAGDRVPRKERVRCSNVPTMQVILTIM